MKAPSQAELARRRAPEPLDLLLLKSGVQRALEQELVLSKKMQVLVDNDPLNLTADVDLRIQKAQEVFLVVVVEGLREHVGMIRVALVIDGTLAVT